MSSNNLSLQPIISTFVDDDGMTMDEIVAFSPKSRNGRGLARRRMNVALNQEAKDALARELTESYLVYSNGLLLTPEGDIANQHDYNLSTEEINRQVNAHSRKTEMEEPVDECIIHFPTGFVYSTPPKMTGDGKPSTVIPRTPTRLRRSGVLNVPSALGIYAIDPEEEHVPMNLFATVGTH
jgi:hypothetical protein